MKLTLSTKNSLKILRLKNYSIHNHLMSGGNKMSYILKQSCSFFVAGLLKLHDLLLPTGIQGLMI